MLLSIMELEDDQQSSIIDELDIIELSIMELSLDIDIIELSIDDDGGQLIDDDIELSIIELEEASWAKPGTTAAAKLPANRNAAARASSFFTLTSGEC